VKEAVRHSDDKSKCGLIPFKPITIIGGGLAGLTLGIGLRQRGIPVTVLEAGHYPRHRVCGEFISGGGQEMLVRFGLRDLFLQAGASAARTAVFCSGRSQSPLRTLAAPALCLSRYQMDALLAEHFLALGGELQQGKRCQATSAEGMVHANGRRAQALENGWRWFGLKVHAQNVALVADLEMHHVPNGYVGLCRLRGDKVNVCGLFRRRAGAQDSARAWQGLLRGVPGSLLRERLANAVFQEDSFCSVAGLPPRARWNCQAHECSIGDAITMTPPVTGNGMSMAFESAEIAIEPLSRYSRGELDWSKAQETVARLCDRRFGRRLQWANWLQWMMFAPIFRGSFGKLVLHSGWVWHTIFSRTR